MGQTENNWSEPGLTREKERERKREQFWEEFVDFYSDPAHLEGLIDVFNTPHHSYDPEEDD